MSRSRSAHQSMVTAPRSRAAVPSQNRWLAIRLSSMCATRTTSPSSVHRRRSTPCVAGWWGPMLIVKSSASGSTCVPASGASIRSSVTDSSRRRYGVDRPGLLIPARDLVLVEGVEDRLAAHREVAPLGVALVVLGHVHAPEVLVAGEANAEEVEDLLLLEVGGREDVGDRGHARGLRRLHGQAHAHAESLAPLGRQQLVMHPEPRLGRKIVAAVQAREHVEGLVGVLAQVADHPAHVLGADVERGRVAEEDSAPHRALADRAGYGPSDQLEPRRVYHRSDSPGTPSPPVRPQTSSVPWAW